MKVDKLQNLSVHSMKLVEQLVSHITAMEAEKIEELEKNNLREVIEKELKVSRNSVSYHLSPLNNTDKKSIEKDEDDSGNTIDQISFKNCNGLIMKL